MKRILLLFTTCFLFGAFAMADANQLRLTPVKHRTHHQEKHHAHRAAKHHAHHRHERSV